MSGVFVRLNEIEVEKLQEFLEKHSKNEGSDFLLAINPTGIGTNVKIICFSCGKVEDITNYTVW